MNVARAIVQGIRLASSNWKLLSLLWLVNLAAALPAALMIGDALDDAFGTSRVAERMTEGFDMDWYAEFEGRARGLEATFSPSIAGPGVVLDNLEAWWSGSLWGAREEAPRAGAGQSGDDQPDAEFAGLLWLGLAYMVGWAFLLGGVLDRLANPREGSLVAHLGSAGGRYFLRFAGLALSSGVVFFLVYRLGGWLYDLVRDATRDVTEERVVQFWAVSAVALVVALLHLVRLVFDVAKIAVVADGHGNVFAGLLAGLRRILASPFKVLGVYVAFVVLADLLLVVYAFTAPGAGPSSFVGVLLALVFAQVYLCARLFLRLGLLGGLLGLYRAAAPSAAG